MDQDNLPELALDWHRSGRGAVLATVIETWGSAPRRVGAQLVVDQAMAMEGSVSGGCVEAAVVHEAVAALADGRPRVLSFGVSDDQAFAVGLACGGTIRILLEPVGTRPEGLPPALLENLCAARLERRPIAYRVNLSSWERSLAGPDATLAPLFRADRSGVEGETFTQIHNPPLRLAVIGAVHAAQHLIPMARACGFDCLVIDPRDAFGTDARFPGTQVSRDWPDEALTTLAPDARTAIVTLTHDPKLDDPALRVALASQAFYIGCLGSTRTHAKRLERLADLGDLSRLRAPVGLAIGAATPAEIAVSILAQIIETLRRP